MESPISAGDVGRYAYCALNWQRSQQGEKGKKSAAGLHRHEEVGKQVDALEYYQAQARWSIQSSFLLALCAISGASLALELMFLESGTYLRLGLIVLSVGWLMGSLYLFLFDIYFRGRGDELIRTSKMVAGDIQYKEGQNQGDLLRSKVLPLQGRPDYVVRSNGDSIPVEVKAGRTPPRPYESHVLQLAAYCYLVQEEVGNRPSHGVLSYPDRNFDVPYTVALEDQLLKTLLRIQLAQRTGDVHRDHQNPRRCANCSRREGCPERLA